MAAPDDTERSELCPLCLLWRKASEGPCDDPDCPIGRPAGEREADIHLELARANLLRMRGDYAAARDACLSILKRFPGDLSAHTLLGDVAAESGDLAQAAQWYEMALDVAPDSQPDRVKLDAVRRRIQEHEAATTAQQLGLPTTKPKALRFAIGTSTFIVLVAVAAFYTGGWSRARSDEPPVIRDSIELKPGQAEPPRPAPEIKTTEPAPAPPTQAADPGVAADRATLDRLRAQCTHGAAIVAATADPRTAAITITVRAVSADGAKQVAAELAISVLRVMPEAPSVTVRVAANDAIVFVADMIQSERATAEPDGQATADPASLLRAEWRVSEPG